MYQKFAYNRESQSQQIYHGLKGSKLQEKSSDIYSPKQPQMLATNNLVINQMSAIDAKKMILQYQLAQVVKDVLSI